MIFMNIAKNGYFFAEKSRLSSRDPAYIYPNNLQMMIFENDPNIEKAISSSWAHWLYIHFVGEWYTEWPFHFDLDPFHSFSHGVNIDFKGQRFRVKSLRFGWQMGWNEDDLVTKRWFAWIYRMIRSGLFTKNHE